jgi:hypothetical protein
VTQGVRIGGAIHVRPTQLTARQGFKLSVVQRRLRPLWLWADGARGAVGWLGVGAVVLILLGVLLVLIVYLPAWKIDPRGLSRTDWLKAVQHLRMTILQWLGGLDLLGILYFSARALQLNRRGQLTERFTKAIEQVGQLGPEKLAVRLGGIYALEHLAVDSEASHWPVMEVLTAFLRENSVRATAFNETALTEVHGPEESISRTRDGGSQPRRQVRTDLQATRRVCRTASTTAMAV